MYFVIYPLESSEIKQNKKQCTIAIFNDELLIL